MSISQNNSVHTFLLPPNITLTEIRSYANAIGATIEYANQRFYLRPRNGGIINIVITNGRPRLH